MAMVQGHTHLQMHQQKGIVKDLFLTTDLAVKDKDDLTVTLLNRGNSDHAIKSNRNWTNVQLCSSQVDIGKSDIENYT